ncbi:TonB-dependent siderophore receptor [Pseudomonas sp. 7P_10.2_Bac1]|uniref:TonB-dependent siderophore receptor n=1 Tax=Pseudomonas sp. 7P_10.2_Bac1 TaxID=2971614 RepID=UPI0021C6B7C6|nr:TonB-dependent siderophore receptor [Pseudomonas sp. 7P_10.2_Bac1]MCU1728138.1 TonB-dependent siderophore receptor [Pseudomonas sp. 7P_10.2_Bac1]
MPRLSLRAAMPLASAVHLALLGVTGASLTALSSQTIAQTQVIDYHISAGSLTTTLSQFAATSQVTLSFASEQTQGLDSPGLQGQYSVDEGLNRLLVNSGLRAQRQSNGSYVLIPVKTLGDTALELSAVSISGKAPGSTTEGTGSYTTESSSSSTRLNLSIRETPQSVTVLTRQRLDDQKLDNLTDALDATTGITVIRESLGADSTTYLSRGFPITNFEIDGVPTSSRMDNYTQNTAMYDRVEVVRGATGLISGLGNPSATINLIRKRPTSTPQVILSAEAGSWDRYGLSVDVGSPLNDTGTVRGRFVADQKVQRAWIDRFNQELTTLYGITEFDLTESTLLTLGFSYQGTHSNAPMRTGFPLFTTNGDRTDIKRSFNTSPDWSYYDRHQSTLFTSVEHHFDNGWSGKLEYSHSRNDYDTVISYMDGEIDPQTGAGALIMPTRWAAVPQQDNLDAYLTGSFPFLGREHELIGGVTLSRLEERGTPNYGGWQQPGSGYDGTIADIYNWDGVTPKPHFNKVGDSDLTETQYAAYLTSRWHLTDAASLIVGARVVDWERDNTSRLNTGVISKTNRTETGVFIPYAGFVYDLDEVWTAYASYTQIFNPQPSTVRDVNGTPLNPLEGTGYELGIKAGFYEGRLNTSLALFRVEQDNLAVADGDKLAPNGFQAYKAENGTTSKGVELEVNGQLTEGWQLTGGYSYSVSLNSDGQRIVTEIPRNSIKLFTTYNLPGTWDKLTVGGGLNWQSQSGYDLSYATTQGSYALASLMAKYQITPEVSASVHVNNLFDKQYLTTTAAGLYGAPRNVMTTLRYAF